MFFLYLMVVHNNPFNTYVTTVPQDGTGLNPLLQNYWMAIHPPSLYTGFVGMTIPYAFGMAALATGHLDDAWLRAVRRWTMIGWLFLSFGLTLGMIWAYEELGWGGYWMWDPVENAGLLPWFTATAFLHSVMVQERRSMMRIWNVTLVIVTFFLTIFGTFMTRSGVVQSVHAFGEDPVLTRLFIIFMIVLLTVSFGLVIYRLPLLKARNELDSWVSREAAFLLNNWILLFSAFFVLFATMFPTISEAVTGTRMTVAAPFFNQWMVPIGLILLFLTGTGPLLAWRKSTISNLRQQFLFPVLMAVGTGGVLRLLGLPFWASGLCFSLSAYVVGTVLQEFWRGTNVRKRNSGTDFFTALVGLVGRNKRRYGGYIVHLGAVLICLGFAGSAYKVTEQVALKSGEQVTVGRYTLRNDGIKLHDDGQKQMMTAYIAIFEGGKQIDTLYPAKWAFRRHEDTPTTEVGIRRTFKEDLYVVMPSNDPQTVATQVAPLEIYVTPLVNWIWLGFGVLAFGTGIALLPERTYSFALAKLPQEAAATTALTLLLFVFAGARNTWAQDGMVGKAGVDTQTSYYARTPFEKQMQYEIVCTCNCGHMPLAECRKDPCGTSHEMREHLAGLIDQGKNHDQILADFVERYGSEEMLAKPTNKGFNRVAWLMPWFVGGTAAVFAGVVAVRWSHRQPATPEATPGVDPAVDERLDDELRNLD
jgi:cytochrome c-type biogenesis protein CcmF